MKLPEKEADNELRKRLQAKFEGFRAPVDEQIRVNVFAALDKSSRRIYWIVPVAALLMIAALLLGTAWFKREADHQAGLPILVKKKSIKNEKVHTKAASQSGAVTTRKRSYTHTFSQNISGKSESKPGLEVPRIMKEPGQQTGINRIRVPQNSAFSFHRTENKKEYLNKTKDPNLNAESHEIPPAAWTGLMDDLQLLSPINSVRFVISPGNIPVRYTRKNQGGENVIKPGLMHGLKGVFSASVLQTFQLVDLSNSTSDRVQNFRFAPLLSAKSLSYKVTAGLEKKHTQLLLSYAYFRSWNEYETGTNQVIATRIGPHQYRMQRVGERHVEDDRSHLIGIGLRQRFMLPQHFLKNYSINLGLDYTLLMPEEQHLIWGNMAFYRQIYQSAGSKLEIGPYVQYSFTERKIAGQTWKSRPYQIGVSLGLRLK